MSRLEDMRNAAAKSNKPKIRAPLPSPTAPPASVPVVASVPESIECSCGHTIGLNAFRKFPCFECQGKARTIRCAKRREKEARKLAAKQAMWAAADKANGHRLPSGAQKVLVWDGEVWRGTLTVPGAPDPFRFVAKTEKKCFHGLHDEYLKWFVAQSAKPKDEGV